MLARYFEEEFQYRNTAASIALKVGRPVPSMASATRYAGPGIDVATLLSDEAIAPGHRFPVVLDVTPQSGGRVVAPGPHRYRPVALRLEPQAHLRVYPMNPPPGAEATVARTERLSAYSQSFRLVQDVAIVVNMETRQLAQKPGATFTIRGTLEYQVCTDTSCGEPLQVPISSTVRLIPLG